MYPILWSWGEFVLASWHLCYALAAVAIFFYLDRLWQRHLGKYKKAFTPLFLWGYLGAYFGARILSILIETDISSVREFFVQLATPGSMTFFGGALGSWLGVSLVLWRYQVPFAKAFDLLAPCLFLGLAIGRIGCFLNGDDYGKIIPPSHNQWWLWSFPFDPAGVIRYPVQLWSALFGLIGFTACQLALAKPWQDGRLACIAASLYCVFRFWVETYRDDPRGWIVENVLSPSQGISLVVLCGLGIFAILTFNKRRSSREHLPKPHHRQAR